MKAGLLVNPSSGKNSGKGIALAAKLQAAPNIPAIVLSNFSELEAGLRHLASQGVTDLAISSGDGTIQAVQTLLAETHIFENLPRLILLPHGTTNMTAQTLGVTTCNLDRLAAMLQSEPALFGALTRQSPTLRIENPADNKPRHGMFTGTGAIWKAVQFCQTAVHGTGLKGEWATFATLATAIAGLFFPGNTPLEERIARPWPFIAKHNGKLLSHGDQLLFLATTLDKLVLGSHPFWGGKQADIRATILPYPVPQVWRWLIPTLYGSEARKMPPGAISIAGDTFEIETELSWVVDGEFFDAPANAALRISRGQDFTYVRL
jgi:diacylglycerol kinase (ATP)